MRSRRRLTTSMAGRMRARRSNAKRMALTELQRIRQPQLAGETVLRGARMLLDSLEVATYNARALRQAMRAAGPRPHKPR
jgi:hypothetical protein